MSKELKQLGKKFFDAISRGDKDLFTECTTNENFKQIINMKKEREIDHGEEEWPALHIAIKHGRLDFVEVLLTEFQESINVNNRMIRSVMEDFEGEGDFETRKKMVTPLYAAIKKEAWGIVDLLLNHPKIDVNLGRLGRLTTVMSPLVLAFRKKNFDLVARFLDFPGIQMDKGESPLYCACRFGEIGLVEKLLHHSALSDINKRILHGDVVLRTEDDDPVDENAIDCQDSPLSKACKKGFTEIVRLLLNDPRIDPVYNSNFHGMNPLACALYAKNMEIFNMLVAQPKFDCNNSATVKFRETDPDYVEDESNDRRYYVPIVLVLQQNNVEAFEKLIAAPSFKPSLDEHLSDCLPEDCTDVLQLAGSLGLWDMFQKMLAFDPDFIICVENGFGLVSFFCKQRPLNLEMFNVLLNSPQFNKLSEREKCDTLNVAAHNKSQEACKALLLHGISTSHLKPEYEDFVLEVKNSLASENKVAE